MKKISKKALSLLLSLSMVFGMAPWSIVTASADSGTKTMYYNQSGFWKDSNCTQAVNSSQKADYTALVVKDGVTSVVPDFGDCTGITSLLLPSSVTSVGASSFADLINLKSVTVMGAATIENYAFYGCTALTDVTMPNATSLGDNSFSQCTSLTSINLPNVTTVGKTVFADCTALTTVLMPNAVSIEDSFYECTALTNVLLPNVTSVSASAFYGCTALIQIALPKAVSIGDEAFRGCKALTTVSLGSAHTIGDNAFTNCASLTDVSIPNVTTLAPYAFNSCTALTGISMPNVLSVGNSAFSCSGLTSVTLPNAATVGDGAFYGCRDLTRAELPNAVSVGDGAFQYCGLKDVALQSTASIVGNAFDSCPALKNLYVVGTSAPAGMPEISNTFLFTPYESNGINYYRLTGNTCTGTGMEIPTDLFGVPIQPAIQKSDLKITDKIAYCNGTDLYSDEGCTSPMGSPARSLVTKIVFAPGVTSIGDKMFDGCNDLAAVTIPESVTSIGEGAFMECESLKNVRIPGPAAIGRSAFDSCSALTNVSIPKVTSVGQRAFNECGALTGIIMPNVTSIGSRAFGGCEALTSIVMLKVASIDYGAFSDCPALTTVVFKGKADTIGDGAFDTYGSGAVTFVVPAEEKAYYEGLLNSDVMGPIKAAVVAGELVTAFDPLPDGTAAQNAANGTPLTSLNLPKTLSATADGCAETIPNVTWKPVTAYDPAKAGAYTFTAVIPSDYILASGVALPTITITVAAASGGSDHRSDSSSSKPAPAAPTDTQSTAGGTVTTITTVPDSAPTVFGSQSTVSVTVPTTVSSAIAAATPEKKAQVKISVPTASLVEQLSSSAVQSVNLTVRVPAAAANNTNENAQIEISADQEVLQAAKDAKKDVTLSVVNSETGREAYSWTFKGSDLAASTAPVKSVDLALSVQPTASDPAVNSAAHSNSGLVLHFADNGVLPSAATVKIDVADQGYKPGQVVYFYYYNPATKAFEQVGNSVAYTVDANGSVSIEIHHCSDYVLLSKAVRSLILDTKTYTLAPQKSYEVGLKQTGLNGMTVKVYSSAAGIAAITKLKNGNYRITGLKPGVTYIMFDVYDDKNRRITKLHASVRLNVQVGAKQKGDSTKQIAVF